MVNEGPGARRSHEYPSRDADPDAAATAGDDRRKILVVEDEPLVRLLAVSILEEAGWRCVEAPTGELGLDHMRRQPDQFAAALVDLGLPGKPGDEIAAEMLKLRAELPIVIVSGHEESTIRARVSGDAIGVVAKPYTAPALIDALSKLGVVPAAA